MKAFARSTKNEPAVPAPLLLRSDNDLGFSSRDYTRLVKSEGLRQESIAPHCPQQNGMVERVIRISLVENGRGNEKHTENQGGP